ncbi:MAG TPA: hypothetical protein VFB92_04245, partial [Vicinamibacterales bacterium]|nr:hypothetical protein [Vicinamibacterales bacterium]
GKSACCVRCGGNWRRDYGGFYTGTKGETLATAKERPTDYRASSRPYRSWSEKKGRANALIKKALIARRRR